MITYGVFQKEILQYIILCYFQSRVHLKGFPMWPGGLQKCETFFSFILEILCIILHTNTISSRCSKPQLCFENIRHKRHSKKTCAKIVPLIKLENWFDNADKNTCSQIRAVAIYLVAEAILLWKQTKKFTKSTSR